jgi:urease accessory protein UreF
VAVAAAEDGRIPMPSAPLLELAAEDHATWEVRLFAS